LPSFVKILAAVATAWSFAFCHALLQNAWLNAMTILLLLLAPALLPALDELLAHTAGHRRRPRRPRATRSARGQLLTKLAPAS
jgi:hypothetical protein